MQCRPAGRSRIIGRKESVRKANRTPPLDVITSMGNGRIAPGEVVYLLAEVRAGDRIHEIGTSARVVAADASSVRLELGGTGAETVSCPHHHVSPARARRERARSPFALRPAVA
jgi:hypothetical protein